MHQVASETKSHAYSHSQPRAAHPPQAPDRAPATPFDSLLDDGAPSATSRPAAPDDHAARADRSEQAPPAATAKGHKAAKTSGEAKPGTKPGSKPGTKANAKSAAVPVTAGSDAKVDKMDLGDLTDLVDLADKPADDCKTADDGKAAADAKIADQAASVPDFQPVGDGKPADSPIPVIVAAAVAVAADPVAPVIAPAETAAPAPTPDVVAQVTSPTDNAAIVATAAETLAPKAKSDPLAALHGDTDKTTDDAKLAPKFEVKTAIKTPDKVADKTADKSAPPSHLTAKPPSNDADKDTIAQARGEPAAGDKPAAPAPAAVTSNTDTTAPKTGADPLQTIALTAPAQHTASATAPVAAAPQLAPQAAAIPLAGIAIEIAGKALAGKHHFEIRLDPPELGRIEVRLDVDRDGNVTSRLIADRSDTLDLLRRDAAGLERSLQDAGLKTTDNGLQFSLRDHSNSQQQDNGATASARLVVEDDTLDSMHVAQRGYSRLTGQGSGIDIQV